MYSLNILKNQAWVAMSPPEADPEATESLFQKAFERKLITKLEHSEVTTSIGCGSIHPYNAFLSNGGSLSSSEVQRASIGHEAMEWVGRCMLHKRQL